MALLIGNKNSESYFIQYIRQRIKRNKNFIMALTGETGSGKSWSAVSLGETLDPDFDIRNVCFQPEEFMNLVNGVTKQLKRGSVIIYDELQVTLSHLSYHSLPSRMINSCLQTFRYMGFILIVTSPYFTLIDASARKLFHCRAETVGINEKLKVCSVKPFLIQTNQRTGDCYFKYLRVAIKGESVVPVVRVHIKKASKELLEEYEEKRKKFSRDLNQEIMEELKRAKEGKKSKAIYRHHCLKCQYEWNSVKEVLVRCPRCQNRKLTLVNEKVTEGTGQQQQPGGQG